MLSEETELFRFFKFDKINSFNKVSRAFKKANKTMIAKALTSAVEIQSIENQVLHYQ